MNATTVQLPVFRVAGLSRDSASDTLAADIEEMRRLWLEGSLKTELAAFSRSFYAVCHAYSDDRRRFTLTAGCLLPNDAELPAAAAEVWLPPQHYLTYPAADGFQAALAAAQAQETQHQPRRYAADFAAVPAFGAPALYIGIEGEVRISEEEVFDD